MMVKLSGARVHHIIFYSNFLSLFFLLPVIIKRRGLSFIPSGSVVLKLLALGAVTLLNTYTFFSAFKHTTIANALMTHYIAPVLVAFLAAIFLGERFTLRILAALTLSSVGLAILIGLSPAEAIASLLSLDSNMVGIVYGLASGVAYAILVVMVRYLAPTEDPYVIVFFQNVAMCALLAPFIRSFPLDALWSLLVIGILHSTMAPLFYVIGLASVRANTAAILGYLEPVFAVLFGVLVLREVPGLGALLGGVLIFIAGYVSLNGRNG